MVATAMFWAAIMVAVLFLVSMLLKIVKGVFVTFGRIGKDAIQIAMLMYMILMVLNQIGRIVEGFEDGSGFGALLGGIGTIVLFFFGLALVMGIITWIVENLGDIIMIPFTIMGVFLDLAIDATERGYIKCLRVLIQKTDKC
ncbi:MAG: hypothetical protein IJY09_06810 [Lachnospiraceae bacterium]|nr:hypothetical protein [Lachnospiraceae bacterium]